MAVDSQPAPSLAGFGPAFSDWAKRFDVQLAGDYSLGRLNTAAGKTLFVEQEGKMSARDYEATIARTRRIPTRQDHWHDRFNALTWLRFPAAKCAVNAALVAEHARRTGNNRNRRADALTMLDETGVVLITDVDDLSRTLIEHDWDRLFLEQRAFWGHRIVPVVYGHGLLEQLLNPYLGLIGRAVILECERPQRVDADRLINQRLPQILTGFASPRDLPPLPVLGIPGWHADNRHPRFYRNTDYFRPPRRKRPDVGLDADSVDKP